MPLNCDSRLSRSLLRKDPDAGKDRRQEEKGMTEDEMVGWHHRVNGCEFEQIPGDGEGDGGLSFSLMCCSPWGHEEADTTEQLKNHHHPCPSSWTLPSGNFRLDCMKLSTTVNHFVPRNGSFMWFNSILLCWPPDPPFGVGTEEELAQSSREAAHSGCCHPTSQIIFYSSPSWPLRQCLPPSASISCFLLILRAHHSQFQLATSRRAPKADPPYAPSSSLVYLLLERQAHVSQGGRMGWPCPPVMPSPQPWGESRHRSVGGLVHPFPLLETQLRPLPFLLLKGTVCVLHTALSKQWLSAGGQSLGKDGKLRHH